MEIVIPEPVKKTLHLTEKFELMYQEGESFGCIVKPSCLNFEMEENAAASLKNYVFIRKTAEDADASNEDVIDALKQLLYTTIAETTPEVELGWSMLYTNDKVIFETLEDSLLSYGAKRFCEKFDLKPKVEQFITEVFLHPLEIFEHADRFKIFSNVKNLMLCILVNFFKVGFNCKPQKMIDWGIILCAQN
jgi:hypothetical protein